MDPNMIEEEIVNKKVPPKKKNKKLPEKFKNYSQEINQTLYNSLDKYTDIYNIILSSDINKMEKDIPAEDIKNLEKFTLEQVIAIIQEEYEGFDDDKTYKRLTKENINDMISRLDKFDISKYEQEADEDIEMIEQIEKKESKSNNTILNSKENTEENQKQIEENLNEKYNFKIGDINNSEIEFSKDKKKLNIKE